jgi:hypothetical protein
LRTHLVRNVLRATTHHREQRERLPAKRGHHAKCKTTYLSSLNAKMMNVSKFITGESQRFVAMTSMALSSFQSQKRQAVVAAAEESTEMRRKNVSIAMTAYIKKSTTIE